MITMKKLNEVDLHGVEDSKKFEVEDLSISLSLKSSYSSSINTTTTKSSDSNLQSILSPSTSTCHAACTSCKNHRRNHTTINTISNQSITSLKKPPSRPVRKQPNLKAYEQQLPNPTYAQQESIYRSDTSSQSNQPRKRRQDLTDFMKQQDAYKISWKEGTGDDLYTSLVTLSIFEEKGHNSDAIEGLSDLLEQGTRELLTQAQPVVLQETLPPRQSDCITLSYRQGPKHAPLTLFHTMKLKHKQERINAYDTAYQHCILATSGLTSWLKRSRSTMPTREAVKWVPMTRKQTLKRSLFTPRRHRSVNETTQGHRKRSVDMISGPVHLIAENPASNETRASFESIEMAKRTRQISLPDVKNAHAIVAIKSPNATTLTRKKRTGRILSSLNRKTSKRAHPPPPPSEKQEIVMTEEGVLNEICTILPQFERSSLLPYVQEANQDYKMALQLCKAAIVSGKLL